MATKKRKIFTVEARAIGVVKSWPPRYLVGVCTKRKKAFKMANDEAILRLGLYDCEILEWKANKRKFKMVKYADENCYH